MINFSRRQLAKYAVDEMVDKQPVKILAARLAAALKASGRQKEADLLLSDIDQELEERGLLAKARVTSAFPLSASARQHLAAQLKKLTNAKDVVMEDSTDPQVIGGLKVETANHSWDRTIKRSLANIKEVS